MLLNNGRGHRCERSFRGTKRPSNREPQTNTGCSRLLRFAMIQWSTRPRLFQGYNASTLVPNPGAATPDRSGCRTRSRPVRTMHAHNSLTSSAPDALPPSEGARLRRAGVRRPRRRARSRPRPIWFSMSSAATRDAGQRNTGDHRRAERRGPADGLAIDFVFVSDRPTG
jgi:hypothetical protein